MALDFSVLTRSLPHCARLVRVRTWFMLLALACCGPLASSVAAQDSFTIIGSDTMVILNRELAAEYAKDHPDVKIHVEGGGSGRGIEALFNGTVDIAASSRAISEDERTAFIKQNGTPPLELVVALDGVGIYVHSYNPVSSLTLEQIRKIFTGEITNWKDVGGQNRRIIFYNRDRFSGTRAYIQNHLLEGRAFSKDAKELSTTALITTCISRNQSAIGYGGIAYCQGTHILTVATEKDQPGYWPSKDDVASGKYPLSRPLYFYINPASNNDRVQAFTEWVRSPAGQEVVTFVGYYPAPPDDADPAGMPTTRESMPKIVTITPQNMQSQGCEVNVEITNVEVFGTTNRCDVTVKVSLPDMHPRTTRKTVLKLGSMAEIPCATDESGLIRVTLQENLLKTTTLTITCTDPDGAQHLYHMAIQDFLE
jgi:phosphate transport system substrate-binding protein